MTTSKSGKIEVENINHPGKVGMADAGKYEAMKQAMLESLPQSSPGLTVAELGRAIMPHLSEIHFPGGERAGWWVKLVQLDLEAKGLVVRDRSSPLRLRKI